MRAPIVLLTLSLSVGTAYAQGAGAAPGRGGPPRQVNVVTAPDLGYTHVLDTLQWPTATVGEEEETSGVAVTSKGHIIAFHRAAAGKAPLLEFDENGRFVKAFGADLGITRAHGLRVDANDNIWITDVNIHQVLKLDAQGKVLMTLGKKGSLGKYNPAAGTELFNQPTDLGFDRDGNVYIANSHGGPDPRIDKFDKNGTFLTSWRVEPKAGDRANVHTIAVDRDGTSYAASREEKMIRVYDAKATLLRTFDMPALVCGMAFDKAGVLWMTTGQDGQIITLDKMTGKVLGVTGRGVGRDAGQYGEAHYIAMTPKGDLYVSDTVDHRVVKLVRR